MKDREMEAEKENCVFPPSKQRSSSPAQRTSPSRPVLGEIQRPSSNLQTPTKSRDAAVTADPWTPTANLKMLISAASPDIRNREREMQEEQLSGDELEKSQPSRKEKSLGLLCHKFLARYPDYPNPAVNNCICLDEVAGELHVERRRIYDIVNVLESLHMVSRLAKNKYLWHGRMNLQKTFETLKNVAEENQYAAQILLLRRGEQGEFEERDGIKSDAVRPLAKQADVSFVELPGMEFRAASVNSRKEKSLRVMSQRFVMLFLVSTPQVVSLEIAAKILIGEDQLEDLDKSKFKTKIRRLYDIANVLSSLHLIKKVHVTEERGRKPAFQWIGPGASADGQDVENIFSPSSPASPAINLRSPKENCAKNLFASRGKQNFTRHPSLIKLAKSIENDRRKINSAPSSPVKTSRQETGSSEIDTEYLTEAPFSVCFVKGVVDASSASSISKMAQLAAICKRQLDKSSEDRMMSGLNNNVKVLVNPAGSSKPEQSPSWRPTFCQALPLIHPNAKGSYAVYLNPTQAGTRSPSAEGHRVLCAHKTFLEDEGNLSPRIVTKTLSMSPADHRPARNESSQDKFSKRPLDLDSGCTSKKLKGSPVQGDSPERLYPSGYLIPVQLASLGTEAGKESASSSEQSVFSSPLAGVIPLKIMFSPGSVAALPVLSPARQSPAAGPNTSTQSVSPATFNFTLQNQDVISTLSPQSHAASPRCRKGTEELSAAQILQFKHLSPVPYRGQPLTLVTLQQPGVPVTPKSAQTLRDSFFQTPGGVTSSPINPPSVDGAPAGTILNSQRKLDVGAED
ncbi:transcription factor E2F8 [Spea bombifrons]|uniref:transcription factor E2F8 n=1 Tax=Spea bombifrons TaxID=233779 RepID=UPI00234BBF93|nr:transcription factor E2F8 [Spea bombifrons]